MSLNGPFDVAIIGSGFGGMGAALSLAERGARIVLCEALGYPGGCASTFTRRGHRFESGATLSSGFAEGQVFRRWIDRHGLDVQVDLLDPVVELRAPGLSLDIPPDRARFLAALMALPGVPPDPLRRFFDLQGRVAEALWALFDDPSLLPPFSPGALLRHARALPRYAPLARLVGRSLGSVLRGYNLDTCPALMTFLNALCQITVQTSAWEAEAPFAMATLDYYFRGTGHVRGGIGALAQGLIQAIEALGGDVRFLSKVKSLREDRGGFRLETRGGAILARQVISNLQPQDLRRLIGAEPGERRTLDRLAREVETGWGAAMLYLTLAPPPGAPDAPRHLELVQDPSAPFIEGNHLFCSISGAQDGERAPGGLRTATVSTHVPLDALRALAPETQGDYIAGIQARMREGLRALAPGWAAGVEMEMTASPRTFQRFTQRHWGYVGGIPRRKGLKNYRQIAPVEILPGLFMVGDAVFPGQSTLATAVGGIRVAEACARRAGLPGRPTALPGPRPPSPTGDAPERTGPRGGRPP